MESIEIDHGGMRRRAWLHFTPRSAGPVPLVVMLHGAGGTAALAAANTRWPELADREGFAVVLPEGTVRDPARPPQFRLNPQVWNDGSGRGHAARRGVDDVGLISTLLDEVGRRVPLVPDGVMVAGFSNGAGLAFRAGAELAGRIAAIGAVSGHCWIERPAPARPVSLMYIMGGRDPLNPLAGGEVETPWGHTEHHPSARQSLDRWVHACRCAAPPEEKDDGAVRWLSYRCGGGAVVRYAEIADAGHVWPGGPRLLPERVAGPATTALDATATLWRFLRERLPGAVV